MTAKITCNKLTHLLFVLAVFCTCTHGQNIDNKVSASEAAAIASLGPLSGTQEQILALPDAHYRFLHDCAITSYKNVLYAAWYNCPDNEIEDESVIRGRYSVDEGKTWSAIQYFARDTTNKYMYVPPAFGNINADLYLYVSRMTGHDQVQDLLVFKLDEQRKEFVQVGHVAIPFIINTAVIGMKNGKLIAGGRRTDTPGTLPLIPAVLISDNGSPLGPWRIVDVQADGKNPDGTSFVFPETGLITNGAELTAIVRSEQQQPVVYKSTDFGTSWAITTPIDLPLSGSSKITCGTLSDGRDFVIGNVRGYDRDKLIIGFRNKGSKKFSKVYLLQDGNNKKLGTSPEWSYPSACEFNKKLYVAYTSGKKAATLSIIPLTKKK
jgi:hypothetical protein